MTHFTPADLDRFEASISWSGFGYLGSRQAHRAAIADGEIPADDLLARADQMLLDHANRHGLKELALFDWCNSKTGRWYGDVWFGGWDGKGAEDLLPEVE